MNPCSSSHSISEDIKFCVLSTKIVHSYGKDYKYYSDIPLQWFDESQNLYLHRTPRVFFVVGKVPIDWPNKSFFFSFYPQVPDGSSTQSLPSELMGIHVIILKYDELFSDLNIHFLNTKGDR